MPVDLHLMLFSTVIYVASYTLTRCGGNCYYYGMVVGRAVLWNRYRRPLDLMVDWTQRRNALVGSPSHFEQRFRWML